MRVRIKALAPLSRSDARRLRRSVKRMVARLLPGADVELGVALLDEDAVRRLNAEYRGLDEPTDVLAFPMMSAGEAMSGTSRKGEPFGDIAICVPVAARQAAERGETPFEEIELLAAHGLLHLAGYDDSEEEAAASMAAMENKLLGRSIIR